MSKINVKKIKNVECYDFETKTNIPFDRVVEVKETKFIKQKLEEKMLEEVRVKKSAKKEPPKEENDNPENAEGGVDNNDSGEGGKGKEES